MGPFRLASARSVDRPARTDVLYLHPPNLRPERYGRQKTHGKLQMSSLHRLIDWTEQNECGICSVVVHWRLTRYKAKGRSRKRIEIDNEDGDGQGKGGSETHPWTKLLIF